MIVKVVSYALLPVLLCACVSMRAVPQGPSDVNVTGIWDGTTQVLACDSAGSGRCDALNKVVFSLQQHGSRIAGRYHCSYGNFECRHEGIDTDGYVQWGDMHASAVRFNVLLPTDLSSCIYNGNVSLNTIAGTYQCYEGGGLIEQGTWRTVRMASAG
jgi:hypothetical protein